MVRNIIKFVSIVAVGAVITTGLAGASKEDNQKVWVCKYVGTPGVNETLKEGKNPISVSENSIKDFQGVGSFFNDKQGRSFVVALVSEENKDNPPTCPVPNEDKDVCSNIDGIQAVVPDNKVLKEGQCVDQTTPPVVTPPVTTPPVVSGFSGK